MSRVCRARFCGPFAALWAGWQAFWAEQQAALGSAKPCRASAPGPERVLPRAAGSCQKYYAILVCYKNVCDIALLVAPARERMITY